jgi:hypothetical protein
MTPIAEAWRRAIAAYEAQCWQLVPIPAGAKGPTAEGWNLWEWQPSDLNPTGNVGLLLGSRSFGVVDVDLDCVEALALADIYLPETGAIFGRQSKPRSHWLFIAPEAYFEAFADPLLKNGKSTLLELRAEDRGGGAHQTLVPPSIVDGERREWCGVAIDPAIIEADKLRTRCAWLAIGCLVRRHISEHASEHPAPDLPSLLYEADPALGRAAYRWLNMPDPMRRGGDQRHAATAARPNSTSPRWWPRSQTMLAGMTGIVLVWPSSWPPGAPTRAASSSTASADDPRLTTRTQHSRGGATITARPLAA